jgi:uncharacterized protein (TIGR02996 family)
LLCKSKITFSLPYNGGMNNVEQWDKLIDEDPGDSFLRLNYADWLEEHGDMEHAYLERWLAKEGIYPYPPNKFANLPHYGWINNLSAYDKEHQIPWYLHKYMVAQYAPYDTRKNAEEFLLTVLKKHHGNILL